MGRLRMSRLGVLAGGATASAGVGLTLGLGLALMVGGAVFAAWCLFLTDVDPPEGDGKEGRP